MLTCKKHREPIDLCPECRVHFWRHLGELAQRLIATRRVRELQQGLGAPTSRAEAAALIALLPK